MTKNIYLYILDAFLATVIVTLIVKFGWIDDFDARITDGFYQKCGEKSEDIIVIGIDQETLQQLGPTSSIPRKYFAMAIDNLNADFENRPAIIGIDGVFRGPSLCDPEGDKLLIESISRYKNIVVGADANFDEDYVSLNESGERVWKWFPPFPALKEVAYVGAINAAKESDNITRHSHMYVNVVDHGKLYSLSRVMYEKYCAYKNILPNQKNNNLFEGRFYIPFTSKTYSKDINFYDLVQGNFDSKMFSGKMVLIGPYSPGRDSYQTSFDRSDFMYGVDIQANIIDTYQKNFIPNEVDRNFQIAILFFVSLIVEFVFRIGNMKTSTIIWLTICLSWLMICHIAYLYELVLNVSWIPLSVTFLFIGAVSTNYIIENREKNQIKMTFSRYIDPLIMKQLLNGGTEALDLKGKLHDIAVLFVDIRGFTSMSEKLPPTTVVEILNRYLTLTAECIRRHHGTLDKFVGDCTMAFWNAPIPQENPVRLACLAALDMLNGSKELGDELMKKYNQKISFGIGVHFGSAIVGNIGTYFRMDYTAIGDTVNTAARLEANAKGGTILISNVVKNMLGNSAEVESLGKTIKLKGKSNDFEIFILHSLEEEEVIN